ncbi:MAG: hypothetical protein V7K89_25405 [Nostoc sp.]
MSTTGYAYAILGLSVQSANALLPLLNILNLVLVSGNELNCDHT